jgi:hypothetical protein
MTRNRIAIFALLLSMPAILHAASEDEWRTFSHVLVQREMDERGSYDRLSSIRPAVSSPQG